MRRDETWAATAAALVLVIGMGFGRFAFTGLYPLMVTDHQISIEGGSYAASANYAGYLIGALLAGRRSRFTSRKLSAISVVVTTVSLGLLGMALPEWLIVLVRGIAGLASAIAMVAASHWLIQDRRHYDGAPALFAGVGLGIVFSAEFIAAGHGAGVSSQTIWLLLALAAAVFSAVTILVQARVERSAPNAPAHATGNDKATSLGATRLVIVYGLSGFGYIITATYLPLLVRTALPSVNPVHIWAIFGLGAVPSCFLWHALHGRWGTSRSLIANLATQAVGVALSIVHTPTAYVLSALIVGGTFTGTVTIAMPAARKVAETVRFNMLAVMTASYGVGQIIGPLLAGAFYARTRSFDTSLLAASVALFLAAGLCVGRGKATQAVTN